MHQYAKCSKGLKCNSKSSISNGKACNCSSGQVHSAFPGIASSVDLWYRAAAGHVNTGPAQLLLNAHCLALMTSASLPPRTQVVAAEAAVQPMPTGQTPSATLSCYQSAGGSCCHQPAAAPPVKTDSHAVKYSCCSASSCWRAASLCCCPSATCSSHLALSTAAAASC